MKFLLDANMPRSAGDMLEKLGHEVADVRDALPAGADDASVATLARAHQLVLVTRDFDFGLSETIHRKLTTASLFSSCRKILSLFG